MSSLRARYVPCCPGGAPEPPVTSTVRLADASATPLRPSGSVASPIAVTPGSAAAARARRPHSGRAHDVRVDARRRASYSAVNRAASPGAAPGSDRTSGADKVWALRPGGVRHLGRGPGSSLLTGAAGAASLIPAGVRRHSLGGRAAARSPPEGRTLV